MFRAVRNKRNEISAEDAKRLLACERRGVLAVNGEDGYPYAVPVNYRYLEKENRIIFHGSYAGYKSEMIAKNGKVCFTVYGNVQVKDEAWAPYVQSAVVLGACRRVEDREETLALLRTFAGKYYPDEATMEEEIARSGKAAAMYVIDIEHLSGKEVQER